MSGALKLEILIREMRTLSSYRQSALVIATIARPNAKPALVQRDRFVHVALWILLEHDSPQCRRFSASRGRIESATHLLGCVP